MVNPISIGAYKCAHVLRKNGYSCLVVHHLSDYSQQDLTALFDHCVDSSTCLIGFSTTFLKSIEIEQDPTKPTPAYPDIGFDCAFPQGKQFENFIIADLLKRNNKIKFAAGGSRVHLNYANRNIDYVCLGFSESSIVNLVDHLSQGAVLNKAQKNIWGVTIIDDKLAENYKFANEDMEWLDIDVVNHKTLPIEIGRGCVFSCKFCAYPMNGKATLDFVKDTEVLRIELQRNYDLFGIKTYQIVDDTFNDHEQKLNMLHAMIKSLSFEPVFWAYIRLDLLHTRKHTIDQLHSMGLRGLHFGIESLNPASAKVIGKGYDFKKSIESIRYIRKTYPDVSIHGSFIIGLPHETVESVTTTYKRLLSQDIPLHSWRFFPFTLDESSKHSFTSDFSKNWQKYGYTKVGMASDTHINWTNEHMSFTQACDMARNFMNESMTRDDFYLESSFGFTLATMGYDLKTVCTMPFKKFDWHHCERNVRPAFVEEYKRKLLSIIVEKTQSTLETKIINTKLSY
jgi:radical SAM superfamily enzyme YgiQ (UPF0313 family)